MICPRKQEEDRNAVLHQHSLLKNYKERQVRVAIGGMGLVLDGLSWIKSGRIRILTNRTVFSGRILPRGNIVPGGLFRMPSLGQFYAF
jgi:hypothetical protein